VREELVGNLTNKELMNYTSVFDGSIGGKAGDQSKLDAVDRRYAWVKRNLKAKEEMWGVFPPQWRVPQLLCMSLCKLTRTHLLEILDATSGQQDVQILLQALHRTIEFEREMDEKFGVGAEGGGGGVGGEASAGDDDDGDEDGDSAGQVRAKYERRRKEKEVSEQRGGRALAMDSAVAAVAKATFRGVISGCFEDYLQSYVELEERQLMDLLDTLVAEETWGKSDASSKSDASTASGRAAESSKAGGLLRTSIRPPLHQQTESARLYEHSP